MKYLKRNILVLLFFCIFLIGCEKKTMKESVTMSFLACGKADITLIQSKNNTVLIDTGEDTCSSTVLAYLEERISSIGLMILTHPDKDHIGNAVEIMKHFDVRQIYASGYRKNSEVEEELLTYVKDHKIQYETLQKSKEFSLGDVKILIEPALKEYDSSNNSSLITYVTIGNIRTFFGADIKKKRIEELLDGKILKSDIVKLPYHGRYNSNLEPLLKKLNPDFVIVTSDQLELETKQLLEKLNIDYEETTKNIEIEIDGISWKRGI